MATRPQAMAPLTTALLTPLAASYNSAKFPATLQLVAMAPLTTLAANNLTVGRNNLTKTFSGLIQDGGISGGTGGLLTKAGNRKLNLTNANTYTGGTTVTQGTLLVRNRTGSATGTGAVQVNAGTL